MKKINTSILFLIVCILMPTNISRAEDTLSNKLSGRILLQVESRGEAWYVNPANLRRYYMANGKAAFDVMRNLGIGITNSNLTKFQNNKLLAQKQKGKIFLQVESSGQAYYVNIDGSLYYLKDGNAAYNIMRSLGLGITNNNLFKIPENAADTQRNTENVNTSEPSSNQRDSFSQITTADISPYLSGVVEVICKKKDVNGVLQFNSTGSGSLWDFSGSDFRLLTNAHVINGNDLCYFWIPSASGINTSIGTYYLDLNNITSWNNVSDEAVIPIVMPSAYPLNPENIGIFNVPISQLNFGISNLRKCSSDIPKISPVMVVGFPAFSSINNSNNPGGIYKDQITTNGIISGYDSSPTNKGLKYSDFYISSIIDSGSSGGIAFSKDVNGLCVLGMPTWLNSGNFSTQGLVQNINNVLLGDESLNLSSSEIQNQICKRDFGLNSIWGGVINSAGGPVCNCMTGYQQSADGTTCVLELSNEQICQNKYGSYSVWTGIVNSQNGPECSCATGYSWDGSGNKCAPQSVLQEWCQNNFGIGSYSVQEDGKAVCGCVTGYALNSYNNYCVAQLTPTQICSRDVGYGSYYLGYLNSDGSYACSSSY